MLSVCDRHGLPRKGATSPPKGTRLLRHAGDLRWKGIKTERYKPQGDTWMDVLRRALIGPDDKTKFHVRYFEIAPGGYTTLEHHRHAHVVIGMKGTGVCRAGKKTFGVEKLDVLYICPGEVHQLRNPHEEPFGFLCIVDAKRDRPKGVSDPRLIAVKA